MRWSFWREAQRATEQLHRALERGDAAAALLATRGKVALSSAAMRAAIEDRRPRRCDQHREPRDDE
jgi:hypothetical protein